MASYFTLFAAVFFCIQYASSQCIPTGCGGPQIIDYQQTISLPILNQPNTCSYIAEIQQPIINVPQINTQPISIGVPNCGAQTGISVGIPNYACQTSINVPNQLSQLTLDAPNSNGNGNGFKAISYCPISPSGINVYCQGELLGNVQISGAMPFSSAVTVDGNVSNCGSGSVNYGCGTNVNLESAGVGYCGQQGGVTLAGSPITFGGSGMNGGCNCGLW